VTFSALANTKTRPLLWAVRRPQKNIFSKSLGRNWARRPGLGPHRRLWSVGTAEAKGRPGAEPSDLWDELPELLRFRSS
jgi:hypothetical protein